MSVYTTLFRALCVHLVFAPHSISLSLISLPPSLLSLVSYFLPSFSPSLSISHPFIVFLQQQGTKVRVRIPRFLQRKRLPQNTIISPLVSECVRVCVYVCGGVDVHYSCNLHTSFISYISYPTSTTDTRPTLLQLTHLVTPSGKTMEIIKSIAAQWRTVGIHMDFDPTGHTVNLIGANHPSNHVACCTDMMMEWLGGRGRQPVNWATLVRVLKNAGFSVLAGDVEQLVLTPAEGRGKS